MGRGGRALAALLFPCLAPPVFGEGGGYWDRSAEGWFWYREGGPPPAEVRPASPGAPSPGAPPELARHEEMRGRLRELRIVAIMSPTPENVTRYLVEQRKALDVSALFADRWQRTVWANAALDYGLRFRPTNSLAAALHDEEQSRLRGERLRRLARTHGLALFTRGNCPACDEMARTLARLEAKHGIHVTAISVDGAPTGIPGGARPDNGASVALGVQAVPSVHLVDPAAASSVPVGHGLLSLREIERRLDVLAGKGPGERF